MSKIKEKLKKELKEVSYETQIFFIISLILIAYLIWGNNTNFKLVLGGTFFIFSGIFSLKESRFTGISQIVAGVFVLSFFYFSRNQIWLLIFLYTSLLGVLLGFLYIHRKISISYIGKGVEITYRLYYISTFIFMAYFAINVMKFVIGFEFEIPLSPWDYILIIELALISIISFFLLIDNVILLPFLSNIRQTLTQRPHSHAHSFFVSLCLIILIDGYFYVNSDSEILQRILIVLGAAFFTSLFISESLKNLLK